MTYVDDRRPERSGGRRRDGRSVTWALVRRAGAAAIAFVLDSLDALPPVVTTVVIVLCAVSALGVVGYWLWTADWAHDSRVTAAGHRRAPARRAEARATTAWIREQRRLVRERRRRERARTG